MKKGTRLCARVTGILAAATLLVGCYAPLANQGGFLNLSLQRTGAGPDVVDPEVVVLVVDSGYQATLAEMLSLISQSYHSSLSSSEQDRLTTLGEQLATDGLVKFGGIPFFQTDISGTSGTFKILGVPAGRQYFLKIFVFNPGVTFDVKSIDQNFGNLIQWENRTFTTESYTTPWQNWTPSTGQPVTVNSSQTATIDVPLSAGVP
ncbi:MAG: hypothetical protein ACLQMF_08950 [Rectinemataceae bacterium]